MPLFLVFLFASSSSSVSVSQPFLSLFSTIPSSHTPWLFRCTLLAAPFQPLTPWQCHYTSPFLFYFWCISVSITSLVILFLFFSLANVYLLPPPYSLVHVTCIFMGIVYILKFFITLSSLMRCDDPALFSVFFLMCLIVFSNWI